MLKGKVNATLKIELFYEMPEGTLKHFEDFGFKLVNSDKFPKYTFFHKPTTHENKTNKIKGLLEANKDSLSNLIQVLNEMEAKYPYQYLISKLDDSEFLQITYRVPMDDNQTKETFDYLVDLNRRIKKAKINK